MADRKRPLELTAADGVPGADAATAAPASNSLAEQGRKRSRFDAGAAPPPSSGTVTAPSSAAAVPVDAVAVARAIASRLAAATTAASAAAAAAGPQPALSHAAVPAAAALSAAAMEAARRAAIMRAQQLAATATAAEPPTAAQSGGGAPKRAALPPPLVLDAQGRALDALGAVMAIPLVPSRSLKINEATRVAPSAADSVAAVVRPSAAAAAAAVRAHNPYLARPPPPAAGEDTSQGELPSRSSRDRRGARGLHFVEVGIYSAAAEEMRERLARSATIAAFREKGTRSKPMFHKELVDEAGAGAAAASSGASAAAAGVMAVEGEGEEASVDGGGERGGAAPAPSLFAALRSSIMAAAAAGSSSSSSSHRGGGPPLATPLPPKQRTAPPEMEWWDAAFLPPARQRAFTLRHSTQGKKAAATTSAPSAPDAGAGDASAAMDETPAAGEQQPLSYAECALGACRTASFVQHPVPTTAAAAIEAAFGGGSGGGAATAPAAPIAIPLMLTKKERKKIRRQQRAERQKERSDQIRLGLLPPPEPKVRLANLMRVLKDSAVADPSALEKKVRAQVAARVQDNAMTNLSRKATPEERREKRRRKLATTAPGSGPEVALFRVSALSNAYNRFKVDVGAKETYLTGMVLQCRHGGTNMVLVEGGVKGVARFVNTLTRRVDWRKKDNHAHAGVGTSGAGDDDSSSDEDDEEEEADDGRAKAVTANGVGSGPGSVCELVWRGTAPRAFFSDFRFEEVRSAAAARKLMETKGLAHMWDSVMASAVRAGAVAEAAEGGRGGAAAASAAAGLGGALAPVEQDAGATSVAVAAPVE